MKHTEAQLEQSFIHLLNEEADTVGIPFLGQY